jgi:peptide deformylase
MSIREILLYPENETELRKKSEPVGVVNRRVRRLIRDLKDTLTSHPEGVGLAAPQINVHSRIVVVRLGIRDASIDDSVPPIALINPVIIDSGSEKRDFDGCISFPGIYGETVRPHYLWIVGLDERGESFNRLYENFDAVVIHHEVDHLDGVLFIDRFERLEDLYRIIEDEDGRVIRVPVSTFLSMGDRQSVIGQNPR